MTYANYWHYLLKDRYWSRSKNGREKTNGKPIFYYVAVVFIVMLLLNSFVFPLFLKNQVVDTSYTQFISDVEAGKVKAVSISDSTIVYMEQNSDGTNLFFRTCGLTTPPC